MIIKNRATKIHVYAYTRSTMAAKTGDAAQITGYISIDGTANAIDDTNPTEVDATNMPGIYAFDLTAAETNCDSFAVYAKSSTSGVSLDPIIGFTSGPTFVAGKVNDAGADTDDFDTDLTEATDDHYNGAYIMFTSGVLTGQSRLISDYTGGSKNIVVATAFTEAPGNGDGFVILGRSE